MNVPYYHGKSNKPVEAKSVKKAKDDIKKAEKAKIHALYESLETLRARWATPGIQGADQRREIMRFPCREQIGMKYDEERGWVSKHRDEQCTLCWPHGHSKYDDPYCNCATFTNPEKCDKVERRRAELALKAQQDRIMGRPGKKTDKVKQVASDLQQHESDPIKESKFIFDYEKHVLGRKTKKQIEAERREERKQWRAELKRLRKRLQCS